jgi:hypothetical protein
MVRTFWPFAEQRFDPLAKTGHDPADIAGVQAEFLAEPIASGVAKARNFVEDTGFSE